MNGYFFVALLCIALSCLDAAPLLSNKENYGIVFDAGSSGTRMYVFKYDLTGYSLTNLPASLQQLEYLKLGDNGIDGLSSVEDVKNLFEPAIKRAESLIPAEFHSRTYLSLAATAGMRLLEISNAAETERIFNLIRAYFQSTSFMFNNPKQQAKILSGTDEAVGEWLMVNYALGKFSTQEPQTYGLLRLGGSSMQIAFTSKITAEPSAGQYLSPIRFNNFMHYIYSHSYLCWGSNKAFDFYQTQAIRNSDFKNKISTACYPKGYTESKVQAELKSPCSNGQALVNEYPFVIKDSEWVENQSHTFNGDSNDDLCKTEVAFIVPRTQCAYSSCGFDAAYQPPNENIPFIATGDFYDTIDNTEKLLKQTIGTNMQKFEELTDFICGKTYDELVAINKESGSGIKKTVHLVCFQNRYMLELFKSFGIKDFKNLEFINKIGEYKVGWAMGHLITQIQNM